MDKYVLKCTKKEGKVEGGLFQLANRNKLTVVIQRIANTENGEDEDNEGGARRVFAVEESAL